MENCLQRIDTVARRGDDEFAILLLDVYDRDAVENLAQDILTEVMKPFYLENRVSTISASMGITRFPEDGLTSKGLLAHAEQAKTRAKGNGGNWYCFFSEEPEQCSAPGRQSG